MESKPWGNSSMLDRRRFLTACSGMGLGTRLFPGVLWAQAQATRKITKEMIDEAAAIAGVAIADDYKQMMLDNLNEQAKGYAEIYALHIPKSVEPALLFDPLLPGMKLDHERKPMRISAAPAGINAAPKNLDEIAFASVRELAELVRTQKVSSLAL